MMRTLKNILRLVAIGSFSMILAACYGMYIRVTSKQYKVTTSSNQPIPDIALTVNKDGATFSETKTGSDGTADITFNEWDGYYTVTLQDTDGALNLGDFENQTLNIEDDLEQTIIMLPKP